MSRHRYICGTIRPCVSGEGAGSTPAARSFSIKYKNKMSKKKFVPREIKFSELGMKVQDILVVIPWLEIANMYMHKHTSWLFAKIEGRT